MARSYSWFRFYHSTLDNPKAQRLPGDLYKSWVNLLCLASRCGGTLPQNSDVAFALRIDETASATLQETLRSRELLDFDPKTKTYRPHDWDDHQFKSDSSTERVKRFRKRHAKHGGNGDETPDETAQEQNRADHNNIEANASMAKRPRATKGARLAIDWKPSEEIFEHGAKHNLTRDETGACCRAFFEYFTSPDATRPIKKDWDGDCKRWITRDAPKIVGGRARSGVSSRNRPGAGSVFAALSENLDAEGLGGQDQPGSGVGRGFNEDRVGDGTPGGGQAESPPTGGPIIDADHFRRVPEGAGETEVDDEGPQRVNGGHTADVDFLRRGTSEVPGGCGEARSGNAEELKPVVAGVVGTQGPVGRVHGAAETPSRSIDERPDLPAFLARQSAVR